MVYFVLFILGVCLGSFVNALVWRLSQQLDEDGEPKKLTKKQKAELSIATGRSMCTHCKHTLAWYDLLPVVSWLSLGGKCRYCKQPIGRQYPLVELLTGVLFVISYVAWPVEIITAYQQIAFVTWLVALVGIVALAVYDIRYMLLPNRILYPLIAFVGASTVAQLLAGRPLGAIWQIVGAITVAGGIFTVLYYYSKGAWIGGGDVTFGILAGLLLGTAVNAFLYLFVASLLGLLYSAPLMAVGRLTKTSKVPFGPFLIASLIIVVLWGTDITNWYNQTFLGL